MSFLKNIFNKNGDQLAREAIDDYAKGRDEFAVISKLQKAISLGIDKYPLDQIYLHIGASYDDLSMFDKAKEAYEKAFEINPDNPSVISNLGGTYKSLGEPEKALELYFDAIRINPRHSYAYHNIGLYYYECGDHFLSLEYLDKAISINPGLSVSYAVKARCMAFMGQYNEANRFSKEAKIRGYDNPDGLKRDIEAIQSGNPTILWNKEKFIALASAISNENIDLLAEINQAISNPIQFIKDNENRFENKHLTSFEIYNLIPFNLLLDYLLDRNLLVIVEQNTNGYNLICDIENLHIEKYSLEENILADFKDNFEEDEIGDLLNNIAAALKIQRDLEILDIYYHDSQLLLTVLDSKTWSKVKYPFSSYAESVGRVRALANEDTIGMYLSKESE